MARIRRRWGEWELYTSPPMSLGCKPWQNSATYHIILSRCRTPEAREAWIKHIAEKAWDAEGLKQAFIDLLAENLPALRERNRAPRKC